METVSDAIDLDGLLIAAGLKEGPGRAMSSSRRTAPPRRSSSPNPRPACRRVSRDSSRPRTGPARCFPARRCPGRVADDTAMRVAVTLAADGRVNEHGVGGFCPIVQDPADNESKIGFGQHGGLGPNEQRPFLMVEGGGFVPGRRRQLTSLIDIAPTVLRHLHMDHDDMDGTALPRDAE